MFPRCNSQPIRRRVTFLLAKSRFGFRKKPLFANRCFCSRISQSVANYWRGRNSFPRHGYPRIKESATASKFVPQKSIFLWGGRIARPESATILTSEIYDTYSRKNTCIKSSWRLSYFDSKSQRQTANLSRQCSYFSKTPSCAQHLA